MSGGRAKRFRKIGHGEWIPRTELEDLLKQAELCAAEDVAVPIPGREMARIIRGYLRLERDFSEVRAACRREIIAIRAGQL